MVIGRSRHWQALLKREGCHNVLSSFFYFTSSRSWWKYPRATLTVCYSQHCFLFVSFYGCGISKIFIFTFTTHTLRSTPPCVHLRTSTTHTCCCKRKVFRDVSLKARKVFLPISHSNKCNRIWFSPGNHGYLHPHYLWNDKTQCCSVWNGADKDSVSLVCAAESALALCCMELSVIIWYCSIWYLH